MNQEQIKQILEFHQLFLKGEAGGVKANLKGADLREADLKGADLREADLKGADLREADLREADLKGADLKGADLREADLREADLRGADLRGANLEGANLRDADLREANLEGANLRWAIICCQGGIQLDFHKPDPELPRRVAIEALKPRALNMSAWHTCETTHCLAGWAIHLSGEAGKILESLTSPSVAGSILMPSASHLFLSDNNTALEWCREQLKENKEAAIQPHGGDSPETLRDEPQRGENLS